MWVHGAGLHVQRRTPAEAFAKLIDAGYVGRGVRRQCSRHPRFGRGLLPHVPRPGHRHPGERAPTATTTTWTPSTACAYWGSIRAVHRRRGRVDDGIMNAAACATACPTCWPDPSATTAPCPAVYGNAYEAQDAMRDHMCAAATTVICMATMLHTIATGNMTPSYPRAGRTAPCARCTSTAWISPSSLSTNSVDRGSLASPRHRHQRPGLHRQHRQRIGAFGLEGCATSERSSPTTTLLSTAFPNGSAIGAMPSR